MFIIIILLITIALLIYYFLTWNFDYWHKKNVKGPKPKPLLGSFPNLLLRKQHFGDDLHDIYKCYKTTENFVGVYLMRTPQLMILDPQIVHEIFVTAFNNFEDNDVGKLIDRAKDPLIAKNPFLLMGEEWRLQRSLITPGLTSARIKQSYQNMQHVCQQLVTFIKQQGRRCINGKDLSLRFTSESLSDCVLGIQANSFSSKPLPITENVRKFAEHNTAFILYTIIVGLVPSILNFYRAKFFPQDCEDFFMDLMNKAYKLRCDDNNEHLDILSHLLKIKDLYKLKDTDMYSHTMTFLIDGLDTTATVISHCLLMLAREPEAQEILHSEVMEACDANGLISFEKLNEMPYLDACIHESLRIYPPGLWATKCCTQSYEVKNKDGRVLKIEKGESIMIPIYALHHDPQYYPEPNKFKPERFLPTNGGGVKHFKDHGVFLGFGDGPRTCLGMRFALVQCKSAISSLIKSFRVKLNTKTQHNYRLDAKSFLALHAGGVWLDFENRLKT
ncbi:probable cytochrome P450 28c1 [Lucilia sericata]|uniref:probable cytochrome P450 28c1 n=1 Tax=Lucilia sericata TaxID=13632 RepID=UPI0018A7ECE6|nr:probable cytochrome P450 28c1 [Lucilia sericata]